MNITPKIFRATVDVTVGRESYAAGDVVPSGPHLPRLIAYGFAVAESKTTNTKKEGSADDAG